MSFANEIKDFLGAWQAGSKILGAADDAEYKRARTKHLAAQTKDLEDPERIKLERDAARSRIGATDASADSSRASAASSRATASRLNDPEEIELGRKAKRSAIEASDQKNSYYRSQQQYLDSLRSPPQARTDVIAPPEFAPRVPLTGQPPAPQTYGEDVEQGIRTPMMAKGGLVQKFEDGGAVEELDDEDEDMPMVAPSARPAIGDTEMSSQSKPSGAKPTFSHEAARDAVHDGIKFNVAQFGLDKPAAVPTAQRQRGLQGYVRGVNAAALPDMNAIRKAVDPEGKMSESERNLAAFGAVWQFKKNQGDDVGAARAAGQMLSHYRQAATRYAALATVAASEGRVDEAARFAMKSYANVPDGKDITITKTKDGRLEYSFIDERTGKTISKGIATPQELAGAAQGIAAGKFDELIMQDAGEKPATSRGKRGAVGADGESTGGGSVKTRAAAEESMTNAWSNFEGTLGKDAKIPPQEKSELLSVATRLFRGNDQMTSDEALQTTMRLGLPNPKNPEATDYELKRLDGGGAAVKFKNGATVKLDPESFERLMFMRNEKTKGMKQTSEKPEGPGLLERAGNMVGQMGRNAVEGVMAFRDENQRAIEARSKQREEEEDALITRRNVAGNRSQGAIPVN